MPKFKLKQLKRYRLAKGIPEMGNRYERHPSLDHFLCVYCGSPSDTRDHVPSRLVRPDLFIGLIVRACRKCNSRLGCSPLVDISKRAYYLLTTYPSQYNKEQTRNLWRASRSKDVGRFV